MTKLNSALKNGQLKSRSLTFDFNPFVESNTLEITESFLPISMSQSQSGSHIHFNATEYWQHLHTKELGQCVLYIDVIDTTMKLFDRYFYKMIYICKMVYT